MSPRRRRYLISWSSPAVELSYHVTPSTMTSGQCFLMSAMSLASHASYALSAVVFSRGFSVEYHMLHLDSARSDHHGVERLLGIVGHGHIDFDDEYHLVADLRGRSNALHREDHGGRIARLALMNHTHCDGEPAVFVSLNDRLSFLFRRTERKVAFKLLPQLQRLRGDGGRDGADQDAQAGENGFHGWLLDCGWLSIPPSASGSRKPYGLLLARTGRAWECCILHSSLIFSSC